MASDLFSTQAIPVGDDKIRRAHMVIRCSECPATDAVPTMSRGGAVSEPLLIRKFTERGWDVGRKASAHKCPDCRPQRRAAGERPVLTVVCDQPQHQEAPVSREMTFADRRIINAKLEEVYENDLVGYREGWHDARVAADLGTSVHWVEELRAQNFGPAEGNQLVAELRAEQAEMAKRLEAFRAEGERLVKAFEALTKRIEQAGIKAAA